MRTAVHGMPRMGSGRALKWALEAFWSGRIGDEELALEVARIRRDNWEVLARAGIDFVPCNDFSLYDHVLDAALAVGIVPERFRLRPGPLGLDGYFAMARGGDLGTGPLRPLDLTKWFDTNYHHLVPEVGPDTVFLADATKACGELAESAALGIPTMPVLLGPLTLCSRSGAAENGFDVFCRFDELTEAYVDLLGELRRGGAAWVRLDEPALAEDRSPAELDALRRGYGRLAAAPERPALVLSTYFGHVGAAMAVLRELPVEGVGLDFCRGRQNLELLEDVGGPGDKILFAGVVDGRNVWTNDVHASLGLLDRLGPLCPEVVVSTSCSLMHVPMSLASERAVDPDVLPWLAFAEEKVAELTTLARVWEASPGERSAAVEENRAVLETRRHSPRVHDPVVRQALAQAPSDPRRSVTPEARAEFQRSRVRVPVLPTTTIGSFPQTDELRQARAAWRGGRSTDEQYGAAIHSAIDRALGLQEEIGLDVLVHGEPERDDMVRYFAAQLTGFALPSEGWVQSYGSRCVRPPVLFGDVSRPFPMSLEWMRYARSRASKPVKGMLTGPLTMMRWSFVRDDQPEADTAAQLGLAVRDELVDLQADGTAVIQVDEPALREGLPLRRAERGAYLAWATRAVRLVTSAARPETQVHTHMCYAQLGDIVDVLDELDVDVVSLEAARSKMALVGDLGAAPFQGGVGPGVYDVHSPVVPSEGEFEAMLRRALEVVGPERLWVNPDCGLKTRSYAEVSTALANMVAAARHVRAAIGEGGQKTP